MTAAVVEVAALVALAVTGWLVVPIRHGVRWRIATALPVGAATHALAVTVLLTMQLPIAHPWAGLGLALVVAGLVRHVVGRATDQRPPAHDDLAATIGRRWLIGGGTTVLLVVALTAVWPLVNLTADSFRYITTAQLLARDADTSAMSPSLLQTRMLAVGAVHGLALPALGYLRAFGPLLGISCLAAMYLLVSDRPDRLDPRVARWVAVGAAALLATTHRFVFSALYVNGHMQFAVWLLLLVAIMWRTLRAAAAGAADVESTSDTAGLAVVVAAGITLVRPEGALVVLLALAPVVIDQRVPLPWRRTLLVGAGSAGLLWYVGVLLPATLQAGQTIPLSVVGMIGAGAGTILLAFMLRPLDGRLGSHPLGWLHGLVWIAVIVLAVRDQTLFIESVKATLRNVVDAGAWGSSLLILTALLVVTIALRRGRAEQALLFPLLTFMPLALLLAFLRDAAYRVGPGDSLNRMLLHVLPLAVLALAAAADSEPRHQTTDTVTGRRASINA